MVSTDWQVTKPRVSFIFLSRFYTQTESLRLIPFVKSYSFYTTGTSIVFTQIYDMVLLKLFLPSMLKVV
jgi:hypothetical protein